MGSGLEMKWNWDEPNDGIEDEKKVEEYQFQWENESQCYQFLPNFRIFLPFIRFFLYEDGISMIP